MKTLRSIFYGVPLFLLCIIGGTFAMLADGFDWAHHQLRAAANVLWKEWNR